MIDIECEIRLGELEHPKDTIRQIAEAKVFVDKINEYLDPEKCSVELVYSHRWWLRFEKCD